jgi:hypothetical protein
VEVKTAQRLLKIIKFCNGVCIGSLIAIPILLFMHDLNFLDIHIDHLIGKAVISIIVILVVLSFFRESVEDIIIERKRNRSINEEDDWWKEHPPGKRAIITDKNTGEIIGTIKNEQLRFLIGAFTEEHMEENNFYFIKELFDLFVQEKEPDPSLEEFIRNALKDKDEITLHWEKE